MIPRFFILLTAGLLLTTPLTAQDSDPVVETTGPAAGGGAPAVQSTVINSDNFRLDLSKNEGIFTGNVRVVDPKFELASDELVIYFEDGSKLKRLVARGNVNIKQADKSSSSRQAEYIIDERKIILTGDPSVMQGRNKITGTAITIYQDQEKMDVDGRSRVQFFP
jgi:lipopolysaccharide export system protein LptA